VNLLFDDTCWSHEDEEWGRSLIELLVLLAMHEQHSVLADPTAMLSWCSKHLKLHCDYFKTRLASAQGRANALTIQISPDGATAVTSDPPWFLTAGAACTLVSSPLRLVLENNRSDQLFVESTVSSFSNWCSRRWIAPTMGGGSEMKKDIDATSPHSVERWRTFYLFDSDRLHPVELSADWLPPAGDGCQGHTFERACANMPRERWHRLNRRSIENYLPQSVLSAANSTATAALSGSSVGIMAYFYNVKTGLSGDGVFPSDPKKTVRASRSQKFWAALPPPDITALEKGFGTKISEEFRNVPANFPWPADVIAETTILAAALQDAM
jgi:hypothetical protein